MVVRMSWGCGVPWAVLRAVDDVESLPFAWLRVLAWELGVSMRVEPGIRSRSLAQVSGFARQPGVGCLSPGAARADLPSCHSIGCRILIATLIALCKLAGKQQVTLSLSQCLRLSLLSGMAALVQVLCSPWNG